MRAYADFHPNELVEATIEGGSIAYVDPAACYDTASGHLISNVYDTLVRFNVSRSLPPAEQGRLDQIVPSLATEWSIAENDPPLVSAHTGLKFYYNYTFKIRDNVPWQNESFGYVNASDVEYCFERGMVLEPGDNPQWMFYEPLLNGATMTYINGTHYDPENSMADREWIGWAIDEAVESNDTHVWFTLAFPGVYAPFMQILTQTWSSIYSKDWANSLGRPSNWNGDWGVDHMAYYAYHFPAVAPFDYPTPAMIGSGPFKLAHLDQTLHYWDADRFADYWGDWPASISGGYLEKVTVSWADDWPTRKAKFIAGEVDICHVPSMYISEMINQPNIRCVSQLPSLALDAYAYQCDIPLTSPYGPIFDYGVLGETGVPRDFFGNAAYGKYVRQAFSHLVDYDKYIETVFLGEATQPATAVIPPLPYYDASIPKYDFNTTKAEALFKQWPGLWETGFTMKILYNIGNIRRQIVSEMLANGINALNPKFHAQAVPLIWAQYLAASSAKQLPVFAVGWLADYPDPHNFVYTYYYTYGYYANRAHYSNATMDALIDEGIRTADGPERAEIYSQIQQLAVDDCPNIPTANALGRHFEQTWVQGWYYNPIYPGNYYYEIWKERISTVSIRPSELTVTRGQEFTVDVDLDYAENVFWYQFKCDFNSSMLSVTWVEYRSYLTDPIIPEPMIVNNIDGYVKFGWREGWSTTVTGGSPPPLARIHFKALCNGTSPLHLDEDDTFLLNDDLITIPIQTSDGIITVVSPEVSVSPSALALGSGQEFSVDVRLDYAENLLAYEFSLSFDSSVVNAVSVDNSGYLGTDVSGPFIEVNNASGYVSLAVSKNGVPGVTGGGVLATVHFTTIAWGTTPLSLFDTVLVDDVGDPIDHGTEDGQVTVGTNLIIESIVVLDQGCTVYANDRYADMVTFYYVPVEVTVKNSGTDAVGAFRVSLSVFWSGGVTEEYVEWGVSGLAADESVTLTYNWHPMHTGSYSFTALVDCYNEVPETAETDNTFYVWNFPVALMGDLDGSHENNILDIVQVGLAWHTHSGDTYWDLRADLNHDGYINILDIVRITLRWHQYSA
jgi:peptide/nickel transport system substrate-binding protein